MSSIDDRDPADFIEPDPGYDAATIARWVAEDHAYEAKLAALTAAKTKPRSRYEVLLVLGYDEQTDTLRLDVDCAEPYARGYRVVWRPESDELCIEAHWQSDGNGCVGMMTALDDPNEARDLLDWLEADDGVASIVSKYRADAKLWEEPA